MNFLVYWFHISFNTNLSSFVFLCFGFVVFSNKSSPDGMLEIPSLDGIPQRKYKSGIMRSDAEAQTEQDVPRVQSWQFFPLQKEAHHHPDINKERKSNHLLLMKSIQKPYSRQKNYRFDQ